MKLIDNTAFRYEGETELVKILEDDFALKNYYDIFKHEDDLRSFTNSLLTNGVKLNSVIAPRLHEICNRVKETLNFTEEIDFYVVSSVHFNAFSVNGFGFFPHIICFHSALIQFFTDEELAFIIGHEIGHLMFKHSQLRIVSMILSESESKNVPAQVRNTYSRWSQYAEISSDRMGFMAQPNLETIGKVFFKLVSGLSEEHLKFDINEYLKQLDQIKNMSYKEFYASHPTSLIRLKCMELFSQSELYHDCKSNPMEKNALLSEMRETMRLLEYHPQSDDQKNAVEFLASVGMYVTCADEEINPKELEIIYEFLSRFTSQPEVYFSFKDFQEVVNRKNAICEHYAQSKNDYKFFLYEQMVFLSVCDGKLDEKEKSVLFEVAERLGIDEDRRNRTIISISSEYLNIKGPTIFGEGIPNFFQGK